MKLLKNNQFIRALFPVMLTADMSGAFGGGAYVPGTESPTSFEDLPAGDYQAVFTASEMKDTKDHMGQYLNLTVQIISGEHNGRKLFDRLNLINRNPDAVKIARQQLEAICRALWITQAIKDSSQLHNKPFLMRVAYVVSNRDGSERPEGQRNDIKSYKPFDGPWQQPSQPAPVQAQPWQQPSQPAPVQAQPWQQPAPAPQAQQPWQQPAPAPQAQQPAPAPQAQQPWQQPAVEPPSPVQPQPQTPPWG